MNNHQLLGVLDTALISSGSVTAIETGSVIIRAIAGDVAITDFVARIAKSGVTSDTSMTLKQGCELLGVKSATVSGSCQVFWTK